jgi:hypothetical protein
LSEKNPAPEYYSKEVKRLKAKVRRVHRKRKLGERYQAELKRSKKTEQETFFRQYDEMEATAGLSSTRMWKGGKEIGKLFLRSKTRTEQSLRTLLEKLTS